MSANCYRFSNLSILMLMMTEYVGGLVYMQLDTLYTKSLIWQGDNVLIGAGSLIQAGVRGN